MSVDCLKPTKKLKKFAYWTNFFFFWRNQIGSYCMFSIRSVLKAYYYRWLQSPVDTTLTCYCLMVYQWIFDFLTVGCGPHREPSINKSLHARMHLITKQRLRKKVILTLWSKFIKWKSPGLPRDFTKLASTKNFHKNLRAEKCCRLLHNSVVLLFNSVDLCYVVVTFILG